jgi:hypothetical protein
MEFLEVKFERRWGGRGRGPKLPTGLDDNWKKDKNYGQFTLKLILK